MTKDEAEQRADSLREGGWPIVYIQFPDDGHGVQWAKIGAEGDDLQASSPPQAII